MAVETSLTEYSYKPGSAQAAESLAGMVFLDSSHLVVTHKADADGAETVLVAGDDYLITGNGRQGMASITALDSYPADDIFHVLRVTPSYQQADINPHEALPAEAVERELDRRAMVEQELEREGERAIKVVRGEVGLILPKKADRAGQFAAFDLNGELIPSSGTGADAGLRTDLAAGAGSLIGFIHSGAGASIVSLQSLIDKYAFPEMFGAAGDGATDDTVAVQAAINTGRIVVLTGSYKITSRLSSIAGGSIIGRKGAQLFMGTGAGEFDNTATYDAPDGTGLLITHDDYLVDGVHFRMEYADDLLVGAIVMRSCDRAAIRNCEFSDFSKSKVVRIESCDDFEVCGNYWHDITTDSATNGQVTCLDLDDNRPTGPSNRGRISGNRFKDITVGASFEAAFGYQTDAINISHQSSSRHTITGNKISNVGEGIDCFGGNSIISENEIKGCAGYGIKIIHGAQQNVIKGNNISDCLIGGIVLAGSTSATQHTSNNLISGNIIARTDAASTATQASSAISTTDNGAATYKAVDNTIENNVIVENGGADWGMEISGTGTGNIFQNNRVDAGVNGKVTNPYNSRYSEASRSLVRAYANAQAIAPGAYTVIQYANGVTDKTGEYNAGTYTFTADADRELIVGAHFATGGASGAKLYELGVFKNGSLVKTMFMTTPTSISIAGAEVATVVPVIKGDTIDIRLRHNEAGSITLSSSPENSSIYIREAA